MHYFTTLFW